MLLDIQLQPFYLRGQRGHWVYVKNAVLPENPKDVFRTEVCTCTVMMTVPLHL